MQVASLPPPPTCVNVHILIETDLQDETCHARRSRRRQIQVNAPKLSMCDAPAGTIIEEPWKWPAAVLALYGLVRATYFDPSCVFSLQVFLLPWSA